MKNSFGPEKTLSTYRKILLVLVAVTIVSTLWVWKSGGTRRPWAVWGETPGDNFGTKAASAGDVNGDGYADVAVWAANFNHNSGKVYIFLGSPKGLSPIPAWSTAGESKGDDYGHSFGGVGDVNGDGIGDFIAAAQGYSTPRAVGAGKAYLYLGTRKGLSPSPVWTRTGDAASEEFGDCSGMAGDINQDGLGDVIVGAYGFDHFRGAVFLFHGSKKTGLETNPAWRGEGEKAGDWFGYSVCSAGDVNHDGFGDIIIGAKQTAKNGLARVGSAYVYLGSKTGLPSRPSWKASGENAQDLFGWRAIRAGDINGDGYDDVLVGAYSHSSRAGANSGKAYVFLGGPGGLSALPAWTQDGEMEGALYGSTLASGDFNHDGYSDVVVGSPNYRPNGKVYLYLGGPQGLPSTPSDTLTGKNEGEHFGAYVANAGDVNGDGYPDFLVGAPDNSEKGYRAGKVYLYYGGKNGKFNEVP